MKTRFRYTGAALVAALFLIIVLAALGATIASLSNVEHSTAVQSQLSTSVYYGAKSGLEWGIQRVISDPAPPARCAAFSGGASFSPAGAGFPGVTVTVTCVQSSTYGAGNFVYYLSSAATVGSGTGALSYAERHMEATVSNIP